MNPSPKTIQARQSRLSPQEERVLGYLQTHNVVTPYAAWEVLKITKLSTVISTLRRKHGIGIRKTRVNIVNSYGEHTWYMSYSLEA